MTDSFDDPAFWLPTKFLDDDDDVPAMDFGADTKSKARKSSGFGFGFDSDGPKALFPFEFGCGAFGISSDLSSPVESVGGFSETESEEEEYLAGLTRQMARSTIESDDFKHSDSVFGSEKPKSWVLSGSPQSTLCALGSGGGSPNTQSPPATWDLLHAAAGEVAKMRINQSRGLLGPPRKPSPVSAPLSNSNATTNSDFGYFLHQQSLSHQKLQATQFQRLRQQQMIKEQSSAVWDGAAQSQYQHQQQILNHPTAPIAARNTIRPLGLSPSAWPALQQAQQYQKNGSDMRAAFLGNQNPGVKRESAGTGVFLPRQISTQSHTRKKQSGGSTVIVPARVVQALNLNIDDIQHPQLQRRFNGRFTPDHDVALRLRSNAAVVAAAISQQKRNNRPQPPPMYNEIKLPQEWTY